MGNVKKQQHRGIIYQKKVRNSSLLCNITDSEREMNPHMLLKHLKIVSAKKKKNEKNKVLNE